MPVNEEYEGLTTDKLIEMPLVIAGPIVRKVTPTEVSIWFVLKQSKDVYVQVFEPNETHKSIGKASTMKIGSLLHIALVTVPISGFGYTALNSGEKYSYNAYFVDQGEPGPTSTIVSDNVNNFDDLWSNGIIYPNSADGDPGSDYANMLTYGSEKYPTFFVPASDPDDLTVAHASCRKPHGGEDFQDKKDALHLLDATIEKWREEEEFEFMKRDSTEPQMLFLTGDQIYADDVHPRLLFMIRNGVKALFDPNYLEEREISFADDSDSNIERDDFVCNNRSNLVYREAGYTSGHPKAHYGLNQLIHTPEYFLMYLFAWSDVLWPSESAVKDITSHIFKYGEGHIEYSEDSFVKYYSVINYSDLDRSSLKNLLSFRRTLPKVRRLLANISTYMMFDDHDVTDDFFLNYNWTKKVLDSRMGRYITSAGLTSFALFQAWGNNPSYFEFGKGQQLLDKIPLWLDNYIGKVNVVHTLDPVGTELEIQELVLPKLVPDNNPYGSSLAGYKLIGDIDWHVNLNFGTYQVVILDPRTKRWFRKPNRESVEIRINHDKNDPFFPGDLIKDYPGYDPAGLLSQSAIETQIPQSSSSSKLTILVSPAPIVGMNSVESGQWHGVNGLGGMYEEALGIHNMNRRWEKDKSYEIGFSSLDAEAWTFNQFAWDCLLHRLLSHENVITLSGDVHYGFTNYTKVFDYSNPSRPYETNTPVNNSQKPIGSERILRMMQCTSSSAKNMTTGTLNMNMGFWIYGNEMRTMITDKRDTDRTYRRTLNFDYDQEISNINFATDNPRYQYFIDTYNFFGFGDDILINNFYCKTYPTRITETQYAKDKRGWKKRRESRNTKRNVNNRWAVGENNFGIVHIQWNNTNKVVKHIMPFYKMLKRNGIWWEDICSTMHEFQFDDKIDNPYQEP